MKADFYAKVGKYSVPVVGAEYPSLVEFYEATKGKNGMYAFWTAVYRKPVDGKAAVWGRAKIGLCAGDRFARMEIERNLRSLAKEDRQVYDEFWTKQLKCGANIKEIRPSNAEELLRWFDSHRQVKFGHWRLVR